MIFAKKNLNKKLTNEEIQSLFNKKTELVHLEKQLNNSQPQIIPNCQDDRRNKK